MLRRPGWLCRWQRWRGSGDKHFLFRLRIGLSNLFRKCEKVCCCLYFFIYRGIRSRRLGRS